MRICYANSRYDYSGSDVSIEIGLVGKPNVGKSTFFSAATLAKAEIANYPFTTIDANKGVAYIRAKCPHEDFDTQCTPNNSICEGGTRFIPVELIDVAGLVPDAHSGKGLGNKFLDDLRQALALIHVVDAAGATDAEGNPCDVGSHNPETDVAFLEREIHHWMLSLLQKDWNRISKHAEMSGGKIEKVLHEKFTGLRISLPHIITALREEGLSEKPSRWTEDEMLSLCCQIQRQAKPITIAANKCDLETDETIQAFIGVDPTTRFAVCAEAELALRRAEKAGLIEYIPGAPSFSPKEGSSLTEPQKKGLEKIQKILNRFEGTGVQPCIEKIVRDVLDLIVVYPVEDETHLTDKEGRILPDAHLLPKGSTAKDLAYKVHTDLGDNFIRAIDCRTRRVIGHDHELSEGDVIKIIAKS